MDSLQEGILVVQNQKIVFCNKIYEKLTKQENEMEEINMLDVKMFTKMKLLEGELIHDFNSDIRDTS